MMQASTLDPEPRSLKIPAEMAAFTRSNASSRCRAEIRGGERRDERTSYLHVRLPSTLEYSHRSQTARSHGYVRQFIGRAVRVDSEQVRSCGIYASQYQCCPDMSLISVEESLTIDLTRSSEWTHLNNICFSIVIAVTTRGFRPVDKACNSMFDEINAVVNSVSAAVPAPQHRMFSVI